MNDTPETTEAPGSPGRRLTDRLLIVGARRHCRRTVRYLGQGPWTGLPMVGFVDAAQPRYAGPKVRARQLAVHPQAEPVPILGRVEQLAELVDRSGATHVVVAVPGRPARRLRPQLAHMANSDVRVHWINDEQTRTGLRKGLHHPPWSVPKLPWRLRLARLAKRAVDIVGASLGLLMLAPLFAGVAVAIMVTTGRPIFYKQERIGQGGRVFRMWKFRSMRQDAERETGPIWASDHDERCTKLGDWLRHTNIDELPQLVNVVLGDMSLVGPRPERPVFVERFRAALPDYDLRHTVPMGMTGWAQVHGWRGRTSLRKRVQYDLDYIQRWSFWLDIQVLFMTIQHVLFAKTQWKSFPARRRTEP